MSLLGPRLLARIREVDIGLPWINLEYRQLPRCSLFPTALVASREDTCVRDAPPQDASLEHRAALTSPSPRDHERTLPREQMRELRSGADVELAVDVPEVVLDRLRAEEEGRGDVAVRAALAYRERHL
jgi:hypothetical protein